MSMFQERYKKAMLRIALQLGKQNNPLSLEFWDLSRKNPTPELLTIELIKGAELYLKYPENEDAVESLKNVATYLKGAAV